MDKELLAKIKHVCLNRPGHGQLALYKDIGGSSINSDQPFIFWNLPSGNPPEKFLTFNRGKRRENNGDENTQYFLGEFPKTAEEWPTLFPPNATGKDPSLWLGRGHFTFKPVIDSLRGPQKGEAGYKTPKDHQKLRNACFSGHMAGEELKCPMCQKARFNRQVAGYHGDVPTVEEVAKYLIDGIKMHAPTDAWRLTDFNAVCRWLGIPENPSEEEISKFVVRTRAIDLLHSWSKGMGSNYFIKHPITHENVTLAPLHPVGKSNFVAHIIAQNPALADIYREGMVMAFDIEANMTGEDYYKSLLGKFLDPNQPRIVIDSLTEFDSEPLPDSLDAFSRAYSLYSKPLPKAELKSRMVMTGDFHGRDIKISTARRPGRRSGTLNALIMQALARAFGGTEDEGREKVAPDQHYYLTHRDRQEKVDSAPKPQASLLARALINRLK